MCYTKGWHIRKCYSDEVPYFIANKRSFYDIKALRTILKFIKKNKIEILHAHSTSIYTAFLLKLVRPKLRLVWHDHYGLSEYVSQRPSQKLLKTISKHTFAIVACNEDLAKWSKKNLHCKNVIFLPNFVVEDKSKQLATKIPGVKGKRIVCLANLRPQKNHIGLLKLFNGIIAQYPGWTLHLVGKDFKDATSLAVKEYITTNNLSNAVYLYDSRKDVAAVLEEMDIGVLVSHSEGLPLALLEYGIAGLAVMVTNVGQCAKVVKDTGDVIDNLQEEGANVLIKLMNDLSYRSKQGLNFKDRVLQYYSEKSSIETLLKLYRSIN